MESTDVDGSPENSLLTYKALPVDVRKTLLKQVDTLPNPLNSKDGQNFLVKFLNERTSGEMVEITQEIKKNFPLSNAKSLKATTAKRQNQKKLTSNERRKLGFQKLPRDGLKYQQFVELHKLWKEYIVHYLDLKKSMQATNQDQLHQRIGKADYHGCLLVVTRSKLPSLVGVKGIVVLETKNTFQIICEDDKLRVIPKRDSVFTFTLDKWTLTLFGNHMNLRPSERAARKFKAKPTIDF